MLSLALWIWTLVQKLPSDQFGWLTAALSVSAVCTLLAQLGIPYLFFSDAHVPERREHRWREALGALLALGPLFAVLGTLLMNSLFEGAVPGFVSLAFLIVDVLAGGVVLAGALWGHSAGRLGIAAGLPALLVISRLVAAGACVVLGQESPESYLNSYLLIHSMFMGLAAFATLAWIASSTGGKWTPVEPSLGTCSSGLRYAVMGGASLAMSELDKPLLARVMGLAHAGHYAMAYRVCAALSMPATAAAAALLPRWSSMIAAGELSRFRKSFLSASVTAVVVGVILAACLKVVLAVFPPGTYGLYEDSWPWMQGLAWLGALLGAHQLMGTALLAIGRPVVRAALDLSGLGLMAVLSFAAFDRWGVAGVVLVCLLAEAVIVFIGTIFVFLSSRKSLV
ncbi:MAG: hypothetical protein JNJ62_06645 [Pseudoxanthomonas mexicana]|nr:hypothetical protein [Pseudoxanthomonas mexicana]